MNHLAVVVVHYRTPLLVRPAIEAMLAEAARAGLAIEIVLVDNGSEAQDGAHWRDLPLRRLAAGANLGYAGGVAAGVAASTAPLVVAMNPDVVVSGGCVAALLAELESGADAAGPQFFWDAAHRLHLPPTEQRTVRAELAGALARRATPLCRLARRRWRRHARRHWLARQPIESTALSGALLAFRRESWRRVGPFDAGYRLYFEETDWLLRLARAGGRSRFVPNARALHLFAQSAIRESAAEGWYVEAERRFRRRQYGPLATHWIELASRSSRGGTLDEASAAPTVAQSDRPLELERGRLGAARPGSWIELSPDPRGFPAAGELLAAGGTDWSLPDDVWRRAGTPRLRVRGVDRAGRESPAVDYPNCPTRRAESAP